MKVVFIGEYDYDRTIFEIKNENIWKTLYHYVAFLAESGNGKDVKFLEEK